ncbi:MAG: chemotaxis protein CheD [Pseudomonadota bacterium]
MNTKVIITQGEHHVSKDPEVIISTILGSCVACCLWDPLAQVGGMNHILLANSRSSAGSPDVNGVNAMEVLINDMLKLGASRSRLKAKAFGGAQMISGLSDIGPANCAFARTFLEREGIECVSESLGGTKARHILFTPTTGTAMMKQRKQEVLEPEITAIPVQRGNDLELF